MVKPKKGGGPAGRRGLTVRVKTAKGRKLASTRWLQRQLNDPYVEEAKRQGYRSRAAFKLIEIDDKHRLLKPGGAYLAKVLQGGAGQELVTRLKQGFAKVAHVKPKASRADSAEVYVLATGFRGAPQ